MKIFQPKILSHRPIFMSLNLIKLRYTRSHSWWLEVKKDEQWQCHNDNLRGGFSYQVFLFTSGDRRDFQAFFWHHMLRF